MVTLIAPKVNINGDSAESLITDHMNAMHAIDAAIDAMKACTPHGRNYQTFHNADEVYKTARVQFDESMRLLREMSNELQKIAVFIDGNV